MQHLPSYLDFSYLGRGVSLHGYSSKAQLLLLTLDKGYLLTAAVPDLQCGIAPLGPPVPAQPLLLGLLLPATGPRLGHGVSLHGCSSKVQMLFFTLEEVYHLTAALPDLQRGIAPLGPPAPAQPLLLGLLLPAAGPGLGRGWLLPTATPL